MPTEGAAIFDNLFIQTINWVDNAYVTFYGCRKQPPSESIGLLVKKDQLANIDSLIANVNALIDESVFSYLNLVKEQDLDTCFL